VCAKQRSSIKHFFTIEALEANISEENGQIIFTTLGGHMIVTEVPDELIENIMGAIKILEEKYF
jgi:hypothetical protein